MSLAENKALIRRYCELFAVGDIDALPEIVAPDVIDHDAYEGQQSGIEGYRQFFLLWKNAFPDLQLEIDFMVAEGDLVAYRWIARGTHLGRYHEIEPTGRPVTVSNISVSRVRDGRVCEDWIEFDEAGLLRQLGALD